LHAYAGHLVDAKMIALFFVRGLIKMAMAEQNQQQQIMAKKPDRL
jgi:hypothetical protein